MLYILKTNSMFRKTEFVDMLHKLNIMAVEVNDGVLFDLDAAKNLGIRTPHWLGMNLYYIKGREHICLRTPKPEEIAALV